jgi:aspartate/methionine/tyrosine aminotransferase
VVRSELSVNATTRTLDALRHRGVDILDLTVSNPTRVGLDYPADLLAPLASPDALTYDPQPLGLMSARAAVAADFARRDLIVPPERIALTASTSEAYSWLFKLLCDPGDAVLVPQPSYPLFEHLTTLESVTARPYRLDPHGGWRIDVDRLVAAIDDRTRAVLVVSPNNPTGSFLHEHDLSRLDEVCSERSLVLIGDEVFADYPLDAAPPARSVMHARNAVVCSLGGLSKTVGLPQIKLGWIGFTGPSSKLEELMPAYELIADTFLSVSTPAQIALPHLLARGADVRAQIQTRIARNLQHLRAAVRTTPAISLLPVEGGWSATLQVPSYRSEEALVIDLLTADHVLVHPGYFFDFERESFVVVSLLVEPEVFDRGIARLLARAGAPGAQS